MDKKIFIETMKHYDIVMMGTVGFMDDEQVERFLDIVKKKDTALRSRLAEAEGVMEEMDNVIKSILNDNLAPYRPDIQNASFSYEAYKSKHAQKG